jgi:glycosyltransferase involved in cell wall biosynthesis
MSNNIKVITIFSPATLPLKSGAGINAFNLARVYTKQGYKVYVVSFKYGDHPTNEVIDGVHITRIPIFYKNLITKIFSFILILPYFTKYLVKSDLAIVYGPLQGYMYTFLLSKILRAKVLFRSTMLDKDDVTSLIYKYGKELSWIRKFVIGLMDGYISQSTAMTDRLIKEYGDSIPYLESAQGVDTQKFFSVNEKEKIKLRTELSLPVDKNIIISVGYVIERKGYKQNIDDLSKINESFLYVIIGNYKPEKGHYMYFAKDEMQSIYNYGKDILNDKLDFIGESSEVHKYLQCADVFILNSSQEGMPNVLLEAMASGLPSVVNKIEGVDGFITINNENSLVIENSAEMDQAINDILSNEELAKKLVSNSEKLIVENYSFEVVSKRILKSLT